MPLPDIETITRDHTVELGDLTITFRTRLLGSETLAQLIDQAVQRQHQTELEEWHNDGQQGDPPEPKDVSVGDMRDLLLASGIIAYYTSQDATLAEFDLEDATAMIRDYPTFVSQGLAASVWRWATEGADVDPFARTRSQPNAPDAG